MSGRGLTVYTLEFAAWWYIDIIAVRAEEFDRIKAWRVRPTAWHDVTTYTINTRTGSKDTILVFFNLDEHVSALNVRLR